MNKEKLKEEFNKFLQTIPEQTQGYKQQVINKTAFYIEIYNAEQELVEINNK